jgi:hypothetical protein
MFLRIPNLQKILLRNYGVNLLMEARSNQVWLISTHSAVVEKSDYDLYQGLPALGNQAPFRANFFTEGRVRAY